MIAAPSVLMSVRAATARYGGREVFRSVTFDVREGQSLGVLGPNGAGKTTLLRMLIGALTPVAGDVRIGGYRPREAMVRTSVAYFAGAATLPRRSAPQRGARSEPVRLCCPTAGASVRCRRA